MALASDLMGLGMAPALAGKVGRALSPAPGSGAAALPGVGTAQVGAQPITSSAFVGAPTTGQTAYALPTSPVEMAKEYYFANAAATAVTALVYPPAGGATLNGSISAAVSVPQNKACLFMCMAGAGGSAPQWIALLGS